MQTSEAELIARSISHDTDAYGQLVERYKHALYRHCFALMRDEDVAEDIAQDSFITAYYKLSTFDPSRRFSTWLFKIATNKSLNTLKANRHVVRMNEATIAQLASSNSSPIEQAKNTELHQLIEQLEPRYRAVVHLYYFEGLSYEEIAVVMAKPVGSIKGWLHRAKTQLRKELV